jgi:outer membrane protein OmpA-like peptidoglycan-associated protein
MKTYHFYLLIAFAILFSACSGNKGTFDQDGRETTVVLNDNVVIKNVVSINTEADEYAPAITGNGKMLYFTSTRPNNFSNKIGDESIWYSIKEGDEWGTPRNLRFLTDGNWKQGTTAIQPDGQYVYFALQTEGRDDGYGNFDLYYAKLEGTRWSQPTNLGATVNSSYWDHNPTISSDGRTLIFASNRPNGFGGIDLWMTKKDDVGNWSRPYNLGTTINTSADEMAPFLALDNRTLYFSSNGKPTVGGFDIFVSQYSSGGWSHRRNVRKPYNSPKYEYFITVPAANDTVYIASNREGSIRGSLDIWLAVPPPLKAVSKQPIANVVTATGVVTEFNSRPAKPIGATLTITDLSNNNTVADFESNSVTGEYYIVLPAGKNYGLTAKAPGYLFYSSQFEVPFDAKHEEIIKDIKLFPLKKEGTTESDKPTVRLMVFFDYDKATLRPESYTDLKNAIEFLKDNPRVYAEIAGHTDRRGTDEYNDKLSQDRASSVASYIVVNGHIDPARVKPVGYGKRSLLFNGDTEEIHQANRRVEMVLIKY